MSEVGKWVIIDTAEENYRAKSKGIWSFEDMKIETTFYYSRPAEVLERMGQLR